AQAKLGEEARQAFLNSQHYTATGEGDLTKAGSLTKAAHVPVVNHWQVKQVIGEKAPHLEYLCSVLRCDDLSWCVSRKHWKDNSRFKE
ncbi:unnamed protein product, partial [Symbiodinium sp. CCMP2456]